MAKIIITEEGFSVLRVVVKLSKKEIKKLVNEGVVLVLGNYMGKHINMGIMHDE